MRKMLAFLWRPGVALWGTIGLLAFYVLLAGPIVWLFWRYHLPDWLALTIHVVYAPLSWTFDNSQMFQEVWGIYRGLWVDIGAGSQATPPPTQLPGAPPYFVETSGTLMGAWLVWNFVRWINQRKMLGS